MKKNEYKLKTIYSNDAQLLHISSESYDKAWIFRLSKHDTQLKYFQINALNQLITIDKRATVKLYDLEKKVELKEIQLNTEFYISVYFDENTKEILIYTDKAHDEAEDEDFSMDYKKYVYFIDSEDFVVLFDKTIELEYHYMDESNRFHQISQYEDSKLYLPFSDEEDDEIFDGYGVVNTKDKQVNKFIFKTHPYDVDFIDNNSIWFAPWFDLGLRPSYTKIEQKNIDGFNCFVYKLDLFRLSTSEIIETIDIREIKEKHIGYANINRDGTYEPSEQVELLKNSDEEDADYTEAFDDFYEDLNHVLWEKDKKAFWILFRGGILRRIDLDGSRSSLIISKDIHKNSWLEDPLAHSYEHSRSIYITENKEIIFGSFSYQDDQMIKFNPKDYDISDEKKILELEMGLVYKTKELSTEDYDELSIALISLEQWNPETCKKALKEILELIQTDIKALIISHEVRMLFKVGSQRVSYQEFYESLEEFGVDIEQDLQNLVEYFVGLEYSREYYHDEETSFLHYAMQTLMRINVEENISLLIRYLRSIDLDHQCRAEELWSELSEDDMKEVQKVLNGEDSEDIETYLNGVGGYDSPYFILLSFDAEFSFVKNIVSQIIDSLSPAILTIEEDLMFLSIECDVETIKSISNQIISKLENEQIEVHISVFHHNCLGKPSETYLWCTQLLDETIGFSNGKSAISYNDFADSENWTGLKKYRDYINENED